MVGRKFNHMPYRRPEYIIASCKSNGHVSETGLKQFGLFYPHEETLSTGDLKGTVMAYQVERGRSFYAWFVVLTMDEYRRLGEKVI